MLIFTIKKIYSVSYIFWQGFYDIILCTMRISVSISCIKINYNIQNNNQICITILSVMTLKKCV